jgi:hypothetical protein
MRNILKIITSVTSLCFITFQTCDAFNFKYYEDDDFNIALAPRNDALNHQHYCFSRISSNDPRAQFSTLLWISKDNKKICDIGYRDISSLSQVAFNINQESSNVNDSQILKNIIDMLYTRDSYIMNGCLCLDYIMDKLREHVSTKLPRDEAEKLLKLIHNPKMDVTGNNWSVSYCFIGTDGTISEFNYRGQLRPLTIDEQTIKVLVHSITIDLKGFDPWAEPNEK